MNARPEQDEQTGADARARQALDQQIEALREEAARTTNPCPVAKLIAVSDVRVRRLLLRKLGDGYRPLGVRCLRPGQVLFLFECPPQTICLIDPSFLVVVDLIAQRVARIVDPYDSGHEAPTASAGSAGPDRLAALGMAAEIATKVVTVTITNVVHRAAKIDGRAVPFDGESGSVEVGPGQHELEWWVWDQPGVTFDAKLEGANEPYDAKRSVSSKKKEYEYFPFTTS